MKKIIALVLCLGISFVLVACGGGSEDTSSISNTTPTVGTIDVSIDSASLIKDNEKDVVIVAFTFKNETQKSLSFKLSTNIVIKQGGEQLSAAIISPSDAYNPDLATTKIGPDEDTKVQLAFELADTTTPIEVECRRLSGEDKSSVTKTLDLN